MGCSDSVRRTVCHRPTESGRPLSSSGRKARTLSAGTVEFANGPIADAPNKITSAKMAITENDTKETIKRMWNQACLRARHS